MPLSNYVITLSLCLSVCLSVCMYVCLSLFLLSLSLSLSLCLSLSLSLFLSLMSSHIFTKDLEVYKGCIIGIFIDQIFQEIWDAFYETSRYIIEIW